MPAPAPRSRPRTVAAAPRRRWRRGAVAALALLVAAQFGCATLDERQRAWIFQPGKSTWRGASAAAEGLDEVWIDYTASDGAAVRLNALWLPQPPSSTKGDAPLLLYLHGARWDVRSSAARMRRLHSLGFAVLGVDYRGFGRSTDTLPSEALAQEDAQAAWRWLAQQHPGRARYIFGHSLGGAIAVQLAAEVGDEAGVIVEGTFTSIPDVVASMRWGWLPLGPLITQRFESVERVSRIASPLLVVHGSEDRLIPPALGRALYEQALEPKRFVLVEGGTHHNTNAVGLDDYREAIAALFGWRAPDVAEAPAQVSFAR